MEKHIRGIISTNLKNYMTEKHMTQAQLSKATGIPASTISGYVARRSTPNAGAVQKMADALGQNKADIDPRFHDSEILSTSPSSEIINETAKVMSQLNAMYQKRVYSYAKEQYENQSLAFPETLAAHQADSSHIINDDEAKNISKFLDAAIDRHENRNK
ncbi:helix-turn-helix domain-containing protein [Levilactobacillus namurensis]|uniref:helix-turn-helix domain-containing protein n=1 Tax=Levilactobacillus namurensis TaxID=380393 RepID=UPI0028B7C5AE|nr:helix-turn-helix domain-containing protein [Levilactobacillus namurensis]MDT7019596.1 helix-turn-helix domain-containing protein [Levilactobacillus namurensis]